MTKRSIAGLLAAACAGTTLLVASPARAESCLTLPSTTGVTLEVAGQEVRIPATSGVAVCVEPGGLPGLPRVDQGGASTDVILVGGGSGTSGYVAVRYTLDGAPTEHRVPIPGTGPGSDICLASIGTDTRDDCLVKATFDDDIIPTIPPTPTVPPTPTLPPIPTAPPLPTLPPTPTVPPVPTVPPIPTVPPTPSPEPICISRPPRLCVPPEVDLEQLIAEWVWWVQNFESGDGDICMDEAPPIWIRAITTSSVVICDEVLPS